MSRVGTKRVDFIGALPYEISLQILGYLNAPELCRCSRVSMTWKKASDDDSLWKRLCDIVWRRKIIFPNPFHVDHGSKGAPTVVLLSVKADYSRCLSSLTTKEMRSLLQRRKINTAALFEKDEFTSAIINSTPTMAPRFGIPGKWKASYAAEKADSRRVAITWEEITNVQWIVVFMSSEAFGHQPHPRILGRFGKDYMWESDMGNHPWHFYGENAVQVAQFPPLYAKRNQKNWSWVLTNEHMKPEDLSALQKPLKDSYKADGGQALITLSAEGSLGMENVTCSVKTGKALVAAGLHPKTGGDGSFACSGDMLLEALVACAGVTFCAVATSFGLTVKGGKVSASGDLDFRGTLGVSKEVPVGFQNIRLRFEVDTDADEALMAKVLQVTERYCVIFQTLKTPPKLESAIIKSETA